MIHHFKPEDLDTLQRFSKLFDIGESPALTRAEAQFEGDGLHMMSAQFEKMNSEISGRGFGVHATRNRAAFRALGEALERHAFAITKPDFVNLSYLDLKKRKLSALDPESFKFFADGQAAIKEGLALQLSRKSRVGWTWFDIGLSDEKILLPSQFNSLIKFQMPLYYVGTTNGNACATSAQDAKLSAVLELVERDAVMFYWWTRNTPRAIDLTEPDPRLGKILARHSRFLGNVSLHYLKTDLRAPTVLAVYKSSEPPYLQVAAACRLDPVAAIEKALNELAHALEYFRVARESFAAVDYGTDFDKSVWRFDDHMMLYGNRQIDGASAFLFRGPQISYRELPSIDTGDSLNNLQSVAADFKKNKLRLYFKDLSDRAVQTAGLHIFRAFSPDVAAIEAHHKLRQLGIPRYYQLAERLGLKRKPRHVRNLNQFPHPFP